MRQSSPVRFPLLFALHVAGGAAMLISPLLATVHAVITIVMTLEAAVRRPLDRVLVASGYCAGCEVLWRTTGARIPHETGKYVLGAALVVAFARCIGRLGRGSSALGYAACLFPSCLLTVFSLGPRQAQKSLIFNVGGPMVIALGLLVARQCDMPRERFQDVLRAVVYGAGGSLGAAILSTVSARQLIFTNESSFVASGGFGPNQVAGTLGLGSLLCFVLLLEERAGAMRLVLQGIGFVLLAQTALTFSRGGLYCAGGGLAVLLVAHAVMGGRLRGVVLVTLVGASVVSFAYPRLDAFTGGALSTRLSNTDTSGRAEFTQSDIAIFRENPLFGVGPGLGSEQRGSAAHTEFTRMLAEHGMLGLTAAALLVVMVAQAVRRARAGGNRAESGALVVWGLMAMATSATRTVAVPIAFTLASLRWTAVRAPATDVADGEPASTHSGLDVLVAPHEEVPAVVGAPAGTRPDPALLRPSSRQDRTGVGVRRRRVAVAP